MGLGVSRYSAFSPKMAVDSLDMMPEPTSHQMLTTLLLVLRRKLSPFLDQRHQILHFDPLVAEVVGEVVLEALFILHDHD